MRPPYPPPVSATASLDNFMAVKSLSKAGNGNPWHSKERLHDAVKNISMAQTISTADISSGKDSNIFIFRKQRGKWDRFKKVEKLNVEASRKKVHK